MSPLILCEDEAISKHHVMMSHRTPKDKTGQDRSVGQRLEEFQWKGLTVIAHADVRPVQQPTGLSDE